MELLVQPRLPGYPAEYLAARIRGRRSFLIRDWNRMLADDAPLDHLSPIRYKGAVSQKNPEGLQRQMLGEYRWVYHQMDRSLRAEFRPFFLYSELRTLFVCLRSIREEGPGSHRESLRESLLSDEVKTLCAAGNDLSTVIRRIGELFRIVIQVSPDSLAAPEPVQLRSVERKITDAVLGRIVKDRQTKLLRMFFEHIIDSRNILRLAQYLHNGNYDENHFIAGGTIATGRLRDCSVRNDLSRTSALIREFSGVPPETTEPEKVEHLLYRTISRFIGRQARDPLGSGLILDYLWRSSIETMNLSLLYYGAGADRDALAGQLVR